MDPRLKTAAEILQASLDAAGIHDADPMELPARIAELRATNGCFVYDGEYPRRDPKQREEKPERVPGGPRLSRTVTSLSAPI
jgi:hypothetical protein